jgi:hypothetical protein
MGWHPTSPNGWWWQCHLDASHGSDFSGCPHGERGLLQFFFGLAKSDWDESWLAVPCRVCSGTMRITYDFVRADRLRVSVVRIVGIGKYAPDYLPMMWETVPLDETEPMFDFKYIRGVRGGNWGLNKPAVFSRSDLAELFATYERKTGRMPHTPN